MPWFRQSIHYDIIQPDPSGPIRMAFRAYMPMEFEIWPGFWFPVRRTIIDTGASLCTFSAAWARQHHFPVPTVSASLPTTTAAGRQPARVYDLDLNARFRRMPEVPFPLAVVFSEAHPPNVPPLVGLHNLLNYWRYTFDGASEPPVATMGHMRFDTLQGRSVYHVGRCRLTPPQPLPQGERGYKRGCFSPSPLGRGVGEGSATTTQIPTRNGPATLCNFPPPSP